MGAWWKIGVWGRIASLLASAAIGIGGAWIILSADEAPRWALAISGLLGLAGAAALFPLLIFTWVQIVEEVRPRLLFKRPNAEMALAHRASSMIGQRRFRMHPVTFMAGLLVANRFYFGFMRMSEAQWETYRELDETPSRTLAQEAPLPHGAEGNPA